jgi:hypothetical protein
MITLREKCVQDTAYYQEAQMNSVVVEDSVS